MHRILYMDAHSIFDLLVKVKSQVGQGQSKTHSIGRWAHFNVNLHFYVKLCCLTPYRYILQMTLYRVT